MTYSIMEGISTLIKGEPLSLQQTYDVFNEIMTGKAQDIQIASFLTALRIVGENSDMITGAAKSMRELSSKISPQSQTLFVDTCGTGGDYADTFNISTLSALVAAGAGVPIAKHGNRSVSSQCGSADLLEAFGVKVDLEPEAVEKVINEIGIGFMFAPKFHPAMKFAMPVRRTLKMRTIFNILGPLTNPANAKAHVLGVFEKSLVEPLTRVMASLGSEHIFVVHSDPGIDEIVPISTVYIGEAKGSNVSFSEYTPAQLGLAPVKMADIRGGDLATNIRIAVEILTNRDHGIKRSVVILNAAYAIFAGGLAKSIDDAKFKAEQSLASKSALKKLHQLVESTGGDLMKFESVFNY